MKFILKTMALLLPLALIAQAADHTYQFSGVLPGLPQNTLTPLIPAGTPFTGTFTFSDAQTMTTTANYGGGGGTYSTFAYSSLTLTILGTTGTSGPGVITMFDNVTSIVVVNVGDTLLVNINPFAISTAGMPLNVNGVQFNWVTLQLNDPTGTALTAGVLPTNLNASSFGSPNPGYAGQMQPGMVFAYTTPTFSTATSASLLTLANVSAAAPPTVTTTSLPPGVFGVPYNAAITGAAPNGDAYTLSVTSLPAGLTFNGSSITGAPGAVGTFHVTITVTDSVTQLATSTTLPLVVSDASISFNPTLPAGVGGTPYSGSFAPATGGTGVFSYSATNLPTGLTQTGNLISGTVAAGTYSIILTATDSAGTAVSVTATLSLAGAPVPCSGTNGVISAYVARNPGFITVNGGSSTLNTLWTTNLSPTTATFLGGLVNWYQSGLIVNWTGTTDPAGCILTSLMVAPAVTVTTPSLPGGTAGVAYSAPVNVSWGVTPYKVTLSGLPSGLSYSNGVISGTPTAIGSFSVGVTVVDGVGATTTATVPLTVIDQTLVFAPTLPAGTAGTAYSAALSASGFGPFTFSASGLPAPLTLSGSSIAGTPAAAGTFAVTLQVTDGAGTKASANVTLTINPAAVLPTTGNYTVQDESQGHITAIDPNLTYLMVGTKKLIWNASTHIQVNTNSQDLHTITGFVKVGMLVQWKGLRDKATNTVLNSQLEVN